MLARPGRQVRVHHAGGRARAPHRRQRSLRPVLPPAEVRGRWWKRDDLPSAALTLMLQGVVMISRAESTVPEGI